MDPIQTHAPQNLFVFFYGTLKRGHHNHNRFIKGASRFVSEATVPGAILLTDGVLPYCVKTGQENDQVQGEVFQISEECLLELDRLENHPHWYQRERVTIDVNTGKPLETWVYFIASNHSQISGNSLTQISDGVWRKVIRGEQI